MSLSAEAAYFDGDQCQHVAAYHEHLRMRRIARERIRSEAARQWAAMPDRTRATEQAREHLASLPAVRLAALNAEWPPMNPTHPKQEPSV